MRSLGRSVVLMVVVGAVMQAAFPHAALARKHRPATHGLPAPGPTNTAIEALLDPFKWDMRSGEVLGILQKKIQHDYNARVAKERDPIVQDRLRHEMGEAVLKLRENYVTFAGKRTSWDVSLVEEEFAHHNNESMLVQWGQKDRRFYFFHNDHLWKVFIAFNSELYADKSFNDFLAVMEERFGPAERKFKTNLKGEAVMSHIEWPPSGNTILSAIDNTGFYGNFCLVLTNRTEAESVFAGRKLQAPTKPQRTIVDTVTSAPPGAAPTDKNEDIVDRITGRGRDSNR